jgi:hypothetical protein
MTSDTPKSGRQICEFPWRERCSACDFSDAKYTKIALRLQIAQIAVVEPFTPILPFRARNPMRDRDLWRAVYMGATADPIADNDTEIPS